MSPLCCEVGFAVVGGVPVVELSLVGKLSDMGVDDGGFSSSTVDGDPKGGGRVGLETIVDEASKVWVEDDPSDTVLNCAVRESGGRVLGEDVVVNRATDKAWHLIRPVSSP